MMSIEGQISESLAMFKKLLEQIVKTIVNKPDHVCVAVESRSDGRQRLAIVVDEQDLGKVIGKNGQTIRSIRGLVNAINPGTQDIAVDVST